MEDEVVEYVLHKLGCKKKSSAYKYLFSAVQVVIRRPLAIHNLMREVYGAVAEQCSLTCSCTVPNAIRKQVEYISDIGTHLIFNDLYQTNMFDLDSKITCGQLIGLIAEYYNLGLYTMNPDFYAYLKHRNENKDSKNKGSSNTFKKPL